MTDTVSDRAPRIWFRLAQVGAGLGLLLLFMVDVFMTLNYGFNGSPRVALVVLGTAWLTAFGWLIAHRLGPVPLGLAGMVVGGWSVAVTMSVESSFTQNPFGFAETAAMLGLLLVVVRRAHPWLVVFGGGALVLAVGAQPFRIGGGQTSYIFALLFTVIAFSVAAVGAYLRAIDSSRRRQVELVRAEQRAEIARDLHDFVAHHVTGIVVQAQGARLIATQDPVRAEAALEQIERAGAEAMASMRRMVGVLRANGSDPDAPLAPLATAADIAPLVAGFYSAGSIRADLQVAGDLDDLPAEIISSAHRVVMESLTNVRRHAHRATRVDVTLHRTADWLLVRVADDGPTAGPPRGTAGFGLIGLTERLQALGGRIQAGPGPDGGWIVDAALPLKQPARLLSGR
jgi:signal transduction histidine kinase